MKKKTLYQVITDRLRLYLNRRPHRSFSRTRRRDYVTDLALPGYFAFTGYVTKILFQNRKLFLKLALVYAVLTFLMVSVASQDSYASMVELFESTSADAFSDFWGKIGSAGLLFLAVIVGGSFDSLSDIQQIYAVLILLLTWLTSVWLLRNVMAGHKVKLRDGLYNAGSPIISTLMVSILVLVQMLPFSLALIGYNAASSTGLLGGGVEAMMFWMFAGLLTILSIYWVTSTFFALIIITLPGMYPFRAIRIAGDLVIGRRLRILMRLVWMVLVASVTWAIVMIPIILFDMWIKGLWPAIDWLPLVPGVLLLLSSISVVWISSYIYLLYRKVVDDEDDA